MLCLYGHFTAKKCWDEMDVWVGWSSLIIGLLRAPSVLITHICIGYETVADVPES